MGDTHEEAERGGQIMLGGIAFQLGMSHSIALSCCFTHTYTTRQSLLLSIASWLPNTVFATSPTGQSEPLA